MIRLDEERIEYENVVVVLGHGDDVTLRGDLEATATGDLDVRTDEVRQKLEKLRSKFICSSSNPPGVNFINVKRTNFSYETSFLAAFQGMFRL